MLVLIDRYLNKLKYNISNEFKNVLYSHPNFPSLLAISDSLTLIEVNNVAAKIPIKHLKELPKEFIAELGDKHKEFYLVEKKSELEFIITDEKKNSKSLSLESLERIWTGIVLIIEGNEEKSIVNNSTNLVIPLVLLLLGILTIVVNNLNFVAGLYLLLSLFGLFISFEIIKTFFKDDSVIESNFCSSRKEFSCNTTIKSKKYVFSNYVEFVDLPVIFFGFTTLGLIFSIVSVNTIGILSSFSLPIILYSIYIQKIVLKKWCPLCLLISLILITNAFLFWYFRLGFKMFTISEIVLIIFIVILWFYVKKLLITEHKNKIAINKLLQFKRNEGVFNAISKDIIDSEEFLSLPKLIIGNTKAANTLTLFLSPSCPHCHTVFEEALNILEKHGGKIKIEIAYNLNINNTENPYLEIAKTIMQLFNQKGDYKSALTDWHINKLNIEKWKTKWSLGNDYLVENEQLEKQFQWCLKNEFNYAPVKIFNNKLMPQEYEINELFFFLKEEN